MDDTRKKVLIIDDDVNVLALLKSGLEASGYSVATCDCVGLSKITLAAFGPDVILMDISMPDGDGISLCRDMKLTENTAQIPVIMLTAFTDEKTFHDAMLFGASGFLTKPFEISEVKKMIEECLAKVNSKKENKT